MSSALCWTGCAARVRDMIQGGVSVDLAVAIADGAETIFEIAVRVDQPSLFGPMASDSTVWRLQHALNEQRLAWSQRADATGRAFTRSRVAGTTGPDALVIDLDAHVLACHWPQASSA